MFMKVVIIKQKLIIHCKGNYNFFDSPIRKTFTIMIWIVYNLTIVVRLRLLICLDLYIKENGGYGNRRNL